MNCPTHAYLCDLSSPKVETNTHQDNLTRREIHPVALGNPEVLNFKWRLDKARRPKMLEVRYGK